MNRWTFEKFHSENRVGKIREYERFDHRDGEARISEKENSRTRLSLTFLRSNMNSYMRYHAYYKKEQVEQLVTKIERNVAFV